MSRRVIGTALLLCAAGCLSEDQWSFGVTRSVYERPEQLSGLSPGPDEEPMDSPAVLLFLAFPVALDLLLLPVAATRDLFVLVL